MASRGSAPSGLFRRIYLTFVLTAVATAITGALASWLMADGLSQRWVGNTIEALSDQNDELVASLEHPTELGTRADALARLLQTRVAVYDLEGVRLAGDGPTQIRRRVRRFFGRLERGRPIVIHPPQRQAIVIFPLTEPRSGRALALVYVAPRERNWRLPIAGALLLMLGLLAVGAWSLSHSLTRRLGRLERSAERIARGELSHRVALDPGPPQDEIDELGTAFNEMAQRVESLIVGQQTLLANVSHELRTPISRIKVLLELLEDRVHRLQGRVAENDANHLLRIEQGMADMLRDTREIEKLIADLLTTGRLQLGMSGGPGLDRRPVSLRSLAERMADRVAATVSGDDVDLSADEMLLERLLSNLLTNARRACPEGEIDVRLEAGPDAVRLVVQDEGPGIAAEDRERVFEPFRRLDAARSRDQGGVGLGLYLCRQIAHAHGGEIEATARPDGRSGARFVVTLPRTPVAESVG